MLPLEQWDGHVPGPACEFRVEVMPSRDQHLAPAYRRYSQAVQGQRFRFAERVNRGRVHGFRISVVPAS